MISKNLIDICFYFQQCSLKKLYWRGIGQCWCRLLWRYVADHFLVNVFHKLNIYVYYLAWIKNLLIYLKNFHSDPISTLSESKRAPSYNSWRKGKRAPSYNSWRKGKRAPSYNSWRKGGKRAPSYNSWRTGKRAPSYDSWRTGKKRVPSYSSWSAGKRVPSYNSWRKGKRSLNNNIKDEDKQDGLLTNMADKRVPTYNSWRKGKRGPAYNSWRKGKRFLNQLASNEPKDELSEEKKSVENDVSAI